jgi:hypothetical protein
MRTRRLAVPAALGLAVALAVTATVAGADPSAHSSAKKVDARVKVRGHSDNTVKGSVKSRKNACEKGRLASLLEIQLDGSLTEVDREKTTRKGKFALEGPPLVPGRSYFVGVGKKTITKFRSGKRPRKTVCKQTESKPFVA